MADETTTGQAPNAGGQEPQPDQQGAAGAQPSQEPERFDAEYVRRLRAEAAEYRKKMRELEQTVKQHEESKLSENEKLQKKLAELEREQALWQRERQERTLKYETMLAASKLGVVDPDAAYKLLDLADIEFDEDGSPKNVEKVLRGLIAKRPYLVGAAGGSPTNPARSTASPTTFTRSQLRDPNFFKAHRDAIMQAMREGRIMEG